ncbi:MAG: tetratricopeptide repeat protein [Deltaproteobacteria bacterium]|nr:tetratricopeptide repeat protein [Deltaproteobacteria bacterium]
MSPRFDSGPIRACAAAFALVIAWIGFAVGASAQDAGAFLGRGDELFARRGADLKAPAAAIGIWTSAAVAFPTDARFPERILAADAYLVRFSPDAKARVQALADGERLADSVAKSFPKSPAGPYYRAVFRFESLRARDALGQLSELGALREDLERAKKIDPAFDFAGPDRQLGILALEAPVRRPEDAVEALESARKLSPNFSSNLAWLARAYDAQGRADEAGALWTGVLAMTASTGFERDLLADQALARERLGLAANGQATP